VEVAPETTPKRPGAASEPEDPESTEAPPPLDSAGAVGEDDPRPQAVASKPASAQTSVVRFIWAPIEGGGVYPVPFDGQRKSGKDRPILDPA
jgi:hypothetical protein